MKKSKIEGVNLNSYGGLLSLILSNGGCLNAYENQDGEMVTLVRGISDSGALYVSKRTLQNNNHTRINRYYEDGTCEEFFVN